MKQNGVQGLPQNLSPVAELNESVCYQAQDFAVIQDQINQVQKELSSVATNIKEQTNENIELKSTFESAQREMDSFKKSTNFRLNLFQSKESKQINDFFAKFLSPSSGTDSLVISELTPLKDLLNKIREENNILKRQLEANPVALEKHAKMIELQFKLSALENQLDPNGNLKPSSLLAKLGSIEKVQLAINSTLMSILEKIEHDRAAAPEKDNDGDATMSTHDSKSYLTSLSKRSRAVDIAELKLKYEDQIEEKNQRILKLERKN